MNVRNPAWVSLPRRILAVVAVILPVLATEPSLGQMQVADSSPATLKQMSLEQLMDLDVTSVSKQPEPYEQAPAAIRVITNDEILRFGASSIPEALRLADNLDVAHATSSTWDISARGFNAGNANKLLVMIDGRAVYTPLYAGVVWNAQDYLLEDIDRIEVVSGPGGSLWGANAVNGVINILSKSAKDTQGLYLEGGGGNWLKDFGAVRYGGTLEPNVYYRVYGKYFDRGAHVFADGSDASDPWRMGQGGFRLDSEADPKNRLTLQGDLYYSTVNLATRVKQDYDGGNLLARWSRSLSEDSGIQVQFYYDWTYWRDPVLAGSFGPAGTLTDNLDTLDLDLQHHFAANDHKVVWGMGYRLTHDSLQNAPSVAFLPPVLSHGLFNCFAQDEVSFAERWKLTLGSKAEHNDYTGWEWEPSARLVWTPADRRVLWAAVSRAVRMPSRIDRDLYIPNSSSPLLAGNGDFESEILVAYELGYRSEMFRSLSFSISTFFNNYDDLRSISLTNGSFPYVITNNNAGQTWGGEVIVDWQVLDGWLVHAGYNMLNEDIWVAEGTDANNALGDTSDPMNQVFFRSSLDLPENMEAATALRWVDERKVVSGTTLAVVPSYVELEARVGWKPAPDVELSVVGRNLLHDHHPEYGYPGPMREEVPRSVYAKLDLRL